MNIAQKLLEFQENNDFADTVIEFMSFLVSETVLSHYGDSVYKSHWNFCDGSRVLLVDEEFKNI